MNLLYNIYSNCANDCQTFLNSYNSQIPQDFVKSASKSFIYSFAISIFLSRGRPMPALLGGSVAVMASTAHVICMTILKSLNIHLSHYLNKPPMMISSKDTDFIMSTTFFASLYLGSSMGFNVNYKASFFATIPFYFWTDSTQQTPITGIVII